MLLALGIILLGGAAFAAAEARTLPARQREQLLKRAATYGAVSPAGAGGITVRERPFTPVVSWIAGVMVRVLPGTSREDTTQRLLRAGLANRFNADEILAAKGLLAVFGLMLGVLVGTASRPAVGFLMAVCATVVGFITPDVLVNGRIRGRRESIQSSLPDALDLLAVTVEAGLGFDGALAKLTENMEGPLADEFALALNEIRIGKSRSEALKRMASRLDVPEVTSFIRSIVQADQLGMSIGAMLRAQAADARVRRELAAEEKAMKLPVKMIFPMVFFLLPAMFIVILGPFFLTFGKNF